MQATLFRVEPQDLQAAEAAAGRKLPLVDQIFSLVSDAIRQGRLRPGSKLPSIRAVADSAEVSRDTATRAYDKLVAHGWLVSRPGAGFFVHQQGDGKDFSAAAPAFETSFHTPGNWRHRMLDPRGSLAGNLGGGELPAAWLNEAGLASALRSVARSKLTWAASYGDAQGYLPLRQQLQFKLRDLGIDAEPRQIMTTIGAADALSLVVTSYLRTPGAKVLVEAPCSFLLLDRLLASGLVVIAVPRQQDGPDIEALKAACEHHRPTMFFCQSLLHNPTSTSLSPQKAYQVLRLADEFNLTLVEDDSYGDLAPPGNAQYARLATVDQLRRVIYIGGFSRTLGPGIRVGFIAAHPDKIAWMLLYKSVTRVSNCSLSERTTYRVLAEGGYRHHCEQLRNQLERSGLALAHRLHELDIAVPYRHEGGVYLWGRLPKDTNAFAVAEAMLEAGYLTAPGPLFSTEIDARTCMRFSVSASESEDAFNTLAKTLTTLAKA